jgi:hypothetical protein
MYIENLSHYEIVFLSETSLKTIKLFLLGIKVTKYLDVSFKTSDVSVKHSDCRSFQKQSSHESRALILRHQMASHARIKLINLNAEQTRYPIDHHTAD